MVARRKLVIALGAGVLVPFASVAQQTGKVWRVAFFYFGSRKAALDTGRLEAFMQGMRTLGYVAGANLRVEEHYADSSAERASALSAKIVIQNPDVIVATGSPAYRVLVNATRQIPIVATVGVDPVGAGYAITLARPGGNVTGLTDTAEFLGPKLLEFLLAVLPRLSRAAVLLNPNNAEHSMQFVRITSDAQKLGIHIVLIEAQAEKGLVAGFATMARENANAVIVLADTFFTDQMRNIADLAIKSGLPAVHANPGFALSGGLLSYGFDLTQNFRRAAAFVDRIFKGAKAGELPFEQPTTYDLIINLKTARTLGIKIPQTILLQATRVIE